MKSYKSDFFLYNLHQANFFLKKGLVPIEVGLGSNKTMYVRFRRNKRAEMVFTEWCNLRSWATNF